MAKTTQPRTDLQRLTTVRTVRPAVALPSRCRRARSCSNSSLRTILRRS